MTTEKRLERFEDRLDRIEAKTERNREAILDLKLAVSSLRERANQYQRKFELIVSEMQEMKADIRSMQTKIAGKTHLNFLDKTPILCYA